MFNAFLRYSFFDYFLFVFDQENDLLEVFFSCNCELKGKKTHKLHKKE